MTFQEIERVEFPPTLILEEGDTVTGILLSRNEVETDGQYGRRMSTVYRLRVEGGIQVEGEIREECALWGSADLDGKMRGIPVPSRVRITYVEKVPQGAKQLKVFRVERDSEWKASGGTASGHSARVASDDIPF